VIRLPLRAVETKPEPARAELQAEADVIPFRAAA